MKILYVTTIMGTMSFFKKEFRHLIDAGNEIEIASNMSNTLSFNPTSFGVKSYDIPFSRSPFSADNIKAYKLLKKIVKENHYDIVHCHTPNAAAITRLACRKIRKKDTRVIYTAHGFHFYKGAPRKNWIIYYPIEWICAHWTDTLITINSEDYKLAMGKMKAGKVEYVPGVGIDLSQFENIAINIKKKREELGIPEDAMVLLSVGELNQNKNHETVVKAIAGMDVYYLIAGKGSKESRLAELAKQMGMEERVRLLGFRRDIRELLYASDVFVFPSYREGLSVSLMEAMASGKPIVASKIRGNVDLIDEKGGALFEPHSVYECRSAVQRVMEADIAKISEYNVKKIHKFSEKVVLKKIDEIYGV